MFGRPVDTDLSMSVDGSIQVFNISNLSTKSVTLYPTRAHITREIDNVVLKPGAASEVQIYGLSPTVDEHSIQVEGQGAATIVDMTVELVPNRDIFEETYPDETDDSDDDSETEFRDSDDEEEAVKIISKELKDLQLQVTEATETQNSATERLTTLDRYSKSASAQYISPDDISKLSKKYEEERAVIFKVHSAATARLVDLKKQVARKEHELAGAAKEGERRNEKIAKQKAKNQRRKELQKAEKRREAKHVKQERWKVEKYCASEVGDF